MKKRYIHCCLLLSVMFGVACNKLDTRLDVQHTDETLATGYTALFGFGYAPYGYLTNGFHYLSGNLFAGATDEAENTDPASGAQMFNLGAVSPYANPDNPYSNDYAGIRAANYFLENSMDYRERLMHNRDIISDYGRQYNLDVQDIAWMRAESRVLRAYFYFDLIKRYGGVPLITKVLQYGENTDLPRNSFDEIIDFIVQEVDGAKDSLQTDWKSYDGGRDGRFTKGAALALKSRALLYAASPLNNPSNDVGKWQKAAAAAQEVIVMGQYSFHPDYSSLFLEDNATLSSESIFAIRLGASNNMERLNYPIGTPGGASGIAPSQNLVDAYEYKSTPDPANPYANRDPRFAATVVYNNSAWNGRTMEIFAGGQDDPANLNTSRTGYYLKKFLNPALNLTQGEAKLRSWIVFRYAEIILNYAEAMNEAYGPDNDNGYGLTARQAINQLRARTSVGMPAVVASGQAEMREKIRHERQIELAFEDHRYWDLLRWKTAETVLNQPLKGMRVSRAGSSFSYQVFEVEKRIFQAPRMYRYPIPAEEINKSKNILTQNEGW
ncbi:MAG: RagB/SusD family nutrient uptake outer membrane protein [Niabella sp.]